MKNEIEEMKNSDEGCSAKCKLMKIIAEKDLDRNKKIVDKMLGFTWCDTCSLVNQDIAAVKGAIVACKTGCG